MHSHPDNSLTTVSGSQEKEVRHYDVVVIGGGTSGLIASIQAARAGASTLLVEKSGVLGGTTTLAGVNVPGIFHAWGRQVIAGIGWELVSRTQLLAGKPLPDFHNWHNKRHWELCVTVNVAVYAALADKLSQESGAGLWLHTMLAAADYDTTNNRWNLLVCRKEGLQRLQTKVLIDCSGDANAVNLSGLPTKRNAVLQPGTLMLHAGGYEMENIDLPALESAFEEEVARGSMLRSDFYTEYNPVSCFLRNRGRNAMHVTGIDANTSDGKTQAELRGRETMLRIIRFLRKHKGLENFTIEQMSPECGIRESVTIEGEVCVRSQDYTSGRQWPDSLCYSFFPIDIHNDSGGGGYVQPISEGIFPTIPLRAQLPRNSKRIIVAGRTLCGDREASSAFRVQATAMATGQVAGAVASLAAQQDCDLRDVPLELVKDLLRTHKAIVPEGNEHAPPHCLLQGSQTMA